MCGGAKGLGSDFKNCHALGVLIMPAEEALGAGSFRGGARGLTLELWHSPRDTLWERLCDCAIKEDLGRG